MIAKDIMGQELAVGDLVVCGEGGHYTLRKRRIKSITQNNVSLIEPNGQCYGRCIRPHSDVVRVGGPHD